MDPLGVRREISGGPWAWIEKNQRIILIFTLNISLCILKYMSYYLIYYELISWIFKNGRKSSLFFLLMEQYPTFLPTLGLPQGLDADRNVWHCSINKKKYAEFPTIF